MWPPAPSSARPTCPPRSPRSTGGTPGYTGLWVPVGKGATREVFGLVVTLPYSAAHACAFTFSRTTADLCPALSGCLDQRSWPEVAQRHLEVADRRLLRRPQTRGAQEWKVAEPVAERRLFDAAELRPGPHPAGESLGPVEGEDLPAGRLGSNPLVNRVSTPVDS
jgi:hypothetical protein